MSWLELAREFVREGIPSRNSTVERYRDPAFVRAVRLARHLRALRADLAGLAPDKVELSEVDGRAQFRYTLKSKSNPVTRTLFLDATGWQLLRDDPKLKPWRDALDRALAST